MKMDTIILYTSFLLSIFHQCEASSILSDALDYCGYETFEAECGDGELIEMTSALYGRMKAGRCISADYAHSIGCYTDVQSFMDTKCSGRPRCVVTVGVLDAIAQPCDKDFSSYLTASYKCIKVEHIRNCRHKDNVTLLAPLGYLAPQPPPSVKVMHRPCDWVIKGQPGQKINITAINLIERHRLSQVEGFELECPLNVIISEKGHGEIKYDLCDVTSRHKEIYMSHTQVVKISVMGHRSSQDVAPVLLNYKVYGCVDLIAPEGAYIRRDGDVTAVICNGTQETWYLTCKEGDWIGTPGNCSKENDSPIIGGPKKEPQATFKHGILLAILIGVILGAFIGAFMLCSVYILRKRRRRRGQGRRGTEELVYEARTRADGSCSGYPASMCHEKLCGSDVSEYTHVWNVHPPSVCTESPYTLSRTPLPCKKCEEDHYRTNTLPMSTFTGNKTMTSQRSVPCAKTETGGGQCAKTETGTAYGEVQAVRSNVDNNYRNSDNNTYRNNADNNCVMSYFELESNLRNNITESSNG